ncbi:MAG TPA: SPOR domain-containing protein, partial [Candidatus Aenigmarchaeota archaeon]|nr:SPOR domain-containing protein [Candidatus Aenigmarchaeota archaeon]
MKRVIAAIAAVFFLCLAQAVAQQYYTIQVGTFRDGQIAKAFKEELKEKECRVVKTGEYTTVYCGKFDNKQEAKKFLVELKEKGITDA